MNMLDYIREQGPLFSAALANREAIAAPFCQICADLNPTKIYLIASGTSRNAALAAAPFMEAVLNVDVPVLAPSQVSSLRGERPLAIVISQGGNSTNSLAVFDRLAGVPTIAMTGNPYGHVNSKGDHYIEIPCGEETVGPKTKGYTITILTLYLMALEYARQCGAVTAGGYAADLAALQTAAEQLPANIAAAEAWCTANLDALKTLHTVYLVGKQQGMQTAGEGALKLMETLLIPGFAFDFEEFLHGPTSSIGEQIGGFYLLPTASDADYERMQRLVAHHRSICPAVYTVGLGESGDPRDCLLQTSGQWFTQPFEQILPMQVVSAAVPPLIGLAGVGSQRFQKLDAVMGIKAKNPKGIV